MRKITNEQDINRRCLPPFVPPDDPNIPEVIKPSPGYGARPPSAYLHTDELIGHTFLMSCLDDGTRKQAEIVGYLDEFDRDLERQSDRIIIKVKVGYEKFDEIVSYNDICDFIEEQTELEDGTWRFRKIIAHRTTDSNGRKKHEVLIEWESEECTYEPISAIYKGDKYLLAEYARDHNLLDEWESPRLKQKHAASKSKKLVHMINQAKLHSFVPFRPRVHVRPRSSTQSC